MEVSKLHITGQNLHRLVDLLKARLPECYAYHSDSVVVLASERFYFRIESNLLTTLILNTAREDSYKVEIVTGGGAPLGRPRGVAPTTTLRTGGTLSDRVDRRPPFLLGLKPGPVQ